MAKAIYWQRGESLDFPNATEATIAANTIVSLGTRVGVVGTDIHPGEKGSLHVTGVFEMPKTATTAITMGAAVYFDGTGITTTAASNVPAGYATQAAAAGDKVVLVKLLG